MTEKKQKLDYNSYVYTLINEIEGLIKLNSFKSEKFGRETSIGWLFVFVHTMLRLRPKKNKRYDGVMWIAYHVGSALLGWYFRVHLAKACDPKRSVEDRKEAFSQWADNVINFHEFMKSEPTLMDKKIFDQEWVAPPYK